MNIPSDISSFLFSNGYTVSDEKKKTVPKNYSHDTIHTASTQDIVSETGRKLREWIYPQDTKEIESYSLFKKQSGEIVKNIQFEFFPEGYSGKIHSIRIEHISHIIEVICQSQYIFSFQNVLEIYADFLAYLYENRYSIQKYFFRDQLSGSFPEINPDEYVNTEEMIQDLYGEGISDFVLVLHYVHENRRHFCVELHTKENSF